MKIRYSQINEFIACPMSYKRRYIDGIQDTEKSSALELGQAIHAAIHTHFEGGDGIEVFKMYWGSLKDTPMKYYRHSWNDLYDLGVNKWLPNFIRLHSKKYSNVKMEEQCEAVLPDGTILTGTYDMCSEYDSVLTMTDWKTSSKEYKKSKILNNPQLWIYCLMYEQKYGVLPKQAIYKVFRKDNGGIQTVPTEITKEKLDLQMQQVSNIIKTMKHMIETNTWYHNFECWCPRDENIIKENK